MANTISDINVLSKFCEDFCSIVSRHAKYVIVSGFLAIATGRARGTEDIDLILQRLSLEKFTQLHQDLLKKNFVCLQSDDPQKVYEYLKENDAIRYTRKNEYIPQMEVKFAKDQIDEEQLEHPLKLPITGMSVNFGDIETTIAFKEALLKSDKDLEDVRHLRITFEEQIDEKKINKVKALLHFR